MVLGPSGGAAYFHDLDSWTEYWDIYHPETRGRYYFGSEGQTGLLQSIVPRGARSPVLDGWKRMALGFDDGTDFRKVASSEPASSAIRELNELVAGVFKQHFGDPTDASVRRSYLEAMQCFATDALPPADYRAERIDRDDPRARTAGRHTMDSDLMWFVWALVVEAPSNREHQQMDSALRPLLLAGIASGCAANFAWRGHRRTRPEYQPDAACAQELLRRGKVWATDLEAAATEVHQLFQIREWGSHR